MTTSYSAKCCKPTFLHKSARIIHDSIIASWDLYYRRGPEALEHLGHPQHHLWRKGTAKEVALRSLRWCSMTKDSKSGWANFNASQLSTAECSFPHHTQIMNPLRGNRYSRAFSTNVEVTIFHTWVCILCIQFVKSSSLSNTKSEVSSEIVNKLTKSKKTAESIPEPKPGPLPYAWLYQYSTSPMNPMNLNMVWGCLGLCILFTQNHSNGDWHDRRLCSSGK